MINVIITLVVVITSGILWHLGGQGHKWCRVCVGGVIGLGKCIMIMSIFPIVYWFFLWGLTSLFSYGISAPPHKFWVWVFGKGEDGDYKPVEIATRLTCGFFWSLAGLYFAILTGQYATLIWSVVYTSVGVTMFGLDKNVVTSEVGTGLTVASAILI